jgi:hypothetical protein
MIFPISSIKSPTIGLKGLLLGESVCEEVHGNAIPGASHCFS